MPAQEIMVCVEQAAVNVNGVIADAAHAVVPVFDHGFLYGEGVYETLRTYNHRPFLLDRHLRRLRASADLIRLSIPQTDTELTDAIARTADQAGVDGERYIRVLVTRGVGDLSYDPATCPEPTVVIIVKAHHENTLEIQSQGIRVIVSSVLRNHPKAINPRIKSNNLLNNALAMQEAVRAGAREALMRNFRGEISECAQSNFFLVRRGEVHTPPLDSGLLEGVTRNFVFEVGPLAGITVRETVLGDRDLVEADEMFITSTTREVLPVSFLDDRPIGSGRPGPLTTGIAKMFRRHAEQLSGLYGGRPPP